MILIIIVNILYNTYFKKSSPHFVRSDSPPPRNVTKTFSKCFFEKAYKSNWPRGLWVFLVFWGFFNYPGLGSYYVEQEMSQDTAVLLFLLFCSFHFISFHRIICPLGRTQILRPNKDLAIKYYFYFTCPLGHSMSHHGNFAYLIIFSLLISILLKYFYFSWTPSSSGSLCSLLLLNSASSFTYYFLS